MGLQSNKPKAAKCPRAVALGCDWAVRRTVGPLGGAFGAAGGRASATYANNLDPDSYFGFSAKIENYQYKLLGIKTMLASVHAENTPGHAVSVRQQSQRVSRSVGAASALCDRSDREAALMASADWQSNVLIPKRVIYIDSEGWSLTASDEYDTDGKLWKTIATFNTYNDRPVLERELRSIPSSECFRPRSSMKTSRMDSPRWCTCPATNPRTMRAWYINMGIVTKAFLDPHQMQNYVH